MRNIEKVIRPYCYKIIPLIYDDSLSYYEVLCKLREKLNEVIENVNNIEDFSGDIKAEVDKILNDWLEDGTIEEMIDAVMKYRDANVTMLYPEYISTFNYYNGTMTNVNRPGQRTPSFDVVQSFCFISNTECIGVRDKRNSDPYQNEGKVFKFSVHDGLATTNDYTYDVGHANDICYDGELVYIAWMTERAHDITNANGTVTAVRTDSNKLTVLDTNLNFVKIMTVPGISRITAIAYNKEEQLYYLYGAGAVYVYDNLENAPLRSFVLNNAYYQNYYNLSGRFAVNTITCLKNSLLFNYSYPSLAIEYDYDGNIIQILNYNEFYQNGFNTLEIEKVNYSEYDGYFYVMSYAQQGLGDYSNNTLGRFSLSKGQMVNMTISATTRENLYTSDSRIYVVNNIDSNAKMLGTFQYPFKYLQQAIDAYKHTAGTVSATIVVVRVNELVTDLGSIAISNKSGMRINTLGRRLNEQGVYVWYFGEAPETRTPFIPRGEITNCSGLQIFNMNFDILALNHCIGTQLGQCAIATRGGFTRAISTYCLANNYWRNMTLSGSTFIGRTYASNDITYTAVSNCYDEGTPFSMPS